MSSNSLIVAEISEFDLGLKLDSRFVSNKHELIIVRHAYFILTLFIL